MEPRKQAFAPWLAQHGMWFWFGGVVVAAFVAGSGAVWWLTSSRIDGLKEDNARLEKALGEARKRQVETPKPNEQVRLEFKQIAALPQQVKQSEKEQATIRFVVHNPSPSWAYVKQAKFTARRVAYRRIETEFLTGTTQLDHTCHRQVFVDKAQPGESLTCPIRFVVPPASTEEFVVWFRLAAPRPEIGFLDLTGTLSLACEGGPEITSESFASSIYYSEKDQVTPAVARPEWNQVWPVTK